MEAKVKAEKLREDERILLAIDKFISSRDDDYERNKGILKEILEDVFTKMKGRDEFFREQFQDFFFVENYYKGPKVGKPEKFDVRIIIKIPLDYKNIQCQISHLGYVDLWLSASPCDLSQWNEYRNLVSKWQIYQTYCESSVYKLDKEAFRQSMKNLLARAILNVPRIDNYTIKVHEDDPAFTMCVNKQGFPEMNVSLVPVLEFDREPPYGPLKKGFKWYAVPEPLKDGDEQNLNWTPVFYNHEDDLLKRHSYLMPVVRMLEKLGDTQEWNVILHYHIKTLAMQYAKSIENDSGLPDTLKLTGIYLSIHMLDRLRNMCKEQRLENFWDSGRNLIDANHTQFADIVEQLTRLINEITDDPAKVADWILTPEELSEYRKELKAVEILQNANGPSKNLQMCQDDEAGSPKDIGNTADGVSKPVAGATAAFGGIESSPSTAGNDKAGCPEEIDIHKVIMDLRDSIETLSHRLTVLEQKPAAPA